MNEIEIVCKQRGLILEYVQNYLSRIYSKYKCNSYLALSPHNFKDNANDDIHTDRLRSNDLLGL